jgi:predicted DNA-binding protein (UPF0251 family)
MPRKKNNRLIASPPVFTEFKPSGIRNRDLESICLSIDEYEALRLADFFALSQEDAAKQMQISRPTFSRVIESARKKMAEFIIKGRRISIEGGDIHFKQNTIKCDECSHIFNIEFDKSIKTCPECGSKQLINLAGHHGHGNCCIDI